MNACSRVHHNPLLLYFLFQVSPGDTGWDVFSLDYHVDGPIATVTSTIFSDCLKRCIELYFKNVIVFIVVIIVVIAVMENKQSALQQEQLITHMFIFLLPTETDGYIGLCVCHCVFMCVPCARCSLASV